MTFQISANREVSLSNEFINVAASMKETKQKETDESAIQAITEAIKAEKFKQTEIVTHCKELSIGWRVVQRVLKHYTDKLWKCEPTYQNNAKQYFLINHTPTTMVKGKSGNSGDTGKTEQLKYQ